MKPSRTSMKWIVNTHYKSSAMLRELPTVNRPINTVVQRQLHLSIQWGKKEFDGD